MESQIEPHLKIVFFDGVCHLCNGFVDFAIQNGTVRNSPEKTLVFAPLQGTTAAKYLKPEEQKALSTVLVWSGGKTLQKSTGVIAVLKELRTPWPWIAKLMELIPAKLRDLVYDWVARNRYAWFGQRDSCRLPLPEEKNQLWP